METIRIILSNIFAFLILISMGIILHKISAYIGKKLRIADLILAIYNKIFIALRK